MSHAWPGAPLLPAAPYSAASPLRVAVLVSGSGTNLQALLDATRGSARAYRIVAVGANRGDAGALSRAQAAGVPTFVEEHRAHPARDAFEHALLSQLAPFAPDVIVLAGFMRVLGHVFVGAYPQRIVNVHPALCPAYPGMHAARQALAAGARITGCTVHLVDTGVDTGPILAQVPVQVLDVDDESSLQRRIQAQEHRLLPRVVEALALGQVRRVEGRVRAFGLAGDSTRAPPRDAR